MVTLIKASYFPNIIEFLHHLKGRKIFRAKILIALSLCFSLHLGLDKQGIIREKTSLANCPFDKICPILIPAKSLYTNLVVGHIHIDYGHMNIHYTRSKLRNRFSIPKYTSIIKSVLNKCQNCFDQLGQRYQVPSVPEYRFDLYNPWKVAFLAMIDQNFVKGKPANLGDFSCLTESHGNAGNFLLRDWFRLH